MALFSAEEAALLERGVVRQALLFRMATSTPVRLWFGDGPLNVPASPVDALATTYQGIGAVQGWPSLNALINGKADRLEIVLNNVSAEIAALAEADAADVRSSVCRFGKMLFAEDWSIGSAVRWMWRGQADVLRTSWGIGENDEEAWTIAISIGSSTTGRTRASYSTWTSASQALRSPDDRGCERTPLYGTTVGDMKWPRW